MTESGEHAPDEKMPWWKLKEKLPADDKFKDLWQKRLKALIDASGRSPTALSRSLDSDDADRVSEILRGQKPTTRNLIRWLASGLHQNGKLKDSLPELNTPELIEIDLSLHAGLLPRQVMELPDEMGREQVIPTLRDIIYGLHVGSQDSQHDLESPRYWLDRFSAQMHAWNALIQFTHKWRHSSQWYEIEEMWNQVQANWELMDNEQRGWAAILRAQTLKMRGLSQDAMTMLEFAQQQFPQELQDPLSSRSRLVHFYLYVTWGDALREVGRLEDAKLAYSRAASYTPNPVERFRMDRKKLDAYTLVSGDAPEELCSRLEHAAQRGSFTEAGQTYHLDPSELAHTRFSVSWLWQDRGMDQLERAIAMLRRGLDELEAAGRTRPDQVKHLLSIGHQYFADTLLRTGRYDLAIEEAEKGEFGNLHYARRAFSNFIRGRALCYKAFCNGQPELLDQAILHLEQAEELYSLMGTSPRRAHCLDELAKFYAFRLVLQKDPSDRQDLQMAHSRLQRAETILNSLGTLRSRSGAPIRVNQVLVGFLDWFSDPAARASRARIEQMAGVIQQLQQEMGDYPLLGHRARAHALSAAFAMASVRNEDLDENWKRRILSHVTHSAENAITRDHLTLHDCRWLISLGASRREPSRLKSFLPLQAVMDTFDTHSNDALKGKPTGLWSTLPSHGPRPEPE